LRDEKSFQISSRLEGAAGAPVSVEAAASVPASAAAGVESVAAGGADVAAASGAGAELASDETVDAPVSSMRPFAAAPEGGG
jgi:hypothetical protein